MGFATGIGMRGFLCRGALKKYRFHQWLLNIGMTQSEWHLEIRPFAVRYFACKNSEGHTNLMVSTKTAINY